MPAAAREVNPRAECAAEIEPSVTFGAILENLESSNTTEKAM